MLKFSKHLKTSNKKKRQKKYVTFDFFHINFRPVILLHLMLLTITINSQHNGKQINPLSPTVDIWAQI